MRVLKNKWLAGFAFTLVLLTGCASGGYVSVDDHEHYHHRRWWHHEHYYGNPPVYERGREIEIQVRP